MGKDWAAQFETCLNTIKGSYTPEQFGVFLNMYSCEVDDNYLVLFHEQFHHWQSVFTPYGQLKWGCVRTVSTKLIELWLTATKDFPNERKLPAADLIPCKDITQASCLAKILTQAIAWQICLLGERTVITPLLKKVLPISIDDITPTIQLQGDLYHLNGIDILESWAKFQEASLANIIDGKHLHEMIDPNKLNKEYYSALYYFFDKIGPNRIVEFPVICELSMATGKLCTYSNDFNWKRYHPAWRFIHLVDIASTLSESEYLHYDRIEDGFLPYTETLLQKSGFDDWNTAWEGAKEYAEQTDLNIPNEMHNAIIWKRKYPWAISFPFINYETLMGLKEFHPYYINTIDGTRFTVASNSFANEVMFEAHYQALAHQICGRMSERCLDRGKLQCGYSYYGLCGCKYLQNEACDGHVDHNSTLIPFVTNDKSEILEGCDFEFFLNLIGTSIREIYVSDILKQIDADMLSNDFERLKATQT